MEQTYTRVANELYGIGREVFHGPNNGIYERDTATGDMVRLRFDPLTATWIAPKSATHGTDC